MTQHEQLQVAQDPELYVEYEPATDSLILSGVGPVVGGFGETVAHNLVAFHNEDYSEVRGVILYGASKLLIPLLRQHFDLEQQSP